MQVIAIPSFFLPSSNAATVSQGTACEATVDNNSGSAVEVLSVTNYCVLKFKTGTNSWTPPSGVTRAYVLVVGGGGGGGNNAGAGGGGGALIYSHFAIGSATSYSISIGSGGAAGIFVDGTTQMDGQSGGASTFISNTSGVSLNAGGGAGGGTHWANNYCGGSPAITGGTSGGTVSSTTGTTVISSASGALGGGVNASGGQAGNGNAGNSNSITGTNYSYGAGGGGGAWGTLWGAGGANGGGNGGTSGAVGSDGAANSGSGGGGGGDGCKNGGAGGSGVVIVKWIPAPINAAATSTTTYFNRGGSFSSSTTSTTSLTRTYQWMVSTNSGSTYANVSDGSGGTTVNYTSAAIDSTSSSYLYRMATTDSDGNISSIGYSAGVSASTIAIPTGETDTALTLNGTDQFVYTTDPSQYSATSNITLEAWVKPETYTANFWNLVICKEGVYQLGFLVYNGVGFWSYGLSSSTTQYVSESTTVRVAFGEWHHIALTRESGSSSAKFYLDGKLAYTGTADRLSSSNDSLKQDNTHPFSIGGRRTSAGVNTGFFKGQIDHVAMFNTARQASDIQGDMQRYISLTESGLQGYFDFNEPSATKIFNRDKGAPAGSDLIFLGAPSFTDVKIIDTSTVENYTIVKFPRTYLNAYGGWKPPVNVTKVSALIVGGGGGGGGGYQGGGGGAGGFLESTVAINSTSNYEIIVGTGGQGARNPTFPTNGENSSAFTMTAIGGGAGMAEFTVNSNNQQSDAQPGGSGGGASHGTNRTGGSGTIGQGNAGANGPDIYPTCSEFAGGGGGGAGSAGFIAICSDPLVSNLNHAGYGGSPKLSYVTNKYYAGGGGGSLRGANGTSLKRGIGGNGDTTTAGDGAYSADVALGATGSATSAPANSGGGGGAGASVDGTKGYGGNGGSGFVAVRWITAMVPLYTKPTNAYLNIGMTETFTTNVLVDSATANLTRTFRWESTTPTSNGAYTLIKQGTGASNAAFSWIPSDSSTSGSGYFYRLIVTDSDTAGLSITDSSTAYAVINSALVVSGTSGIAKTINVAKSETFTITLGTSTYKTTLTSNNPGISLDTSTATSPVVKISETMTVGTYYETLTVIDSVSASIITPLTIVVAAPPNLVNSGEIVSDKLIFNLDLANSASFDRNTRTLSDLSGSKRAITLNGSPTFYEDYSGHMKLLGGSGQYISATGFSTMSSWTIETYFKVDSAAYSCITNQGAASNSTRNFSLCLDAARTMYAGFFNGSAWTYRRTVEQVPLGVWTHVVARWDGTYTNATNGFKIWFDNTVTTTSDAVTYATSAPAATTNTLLISRNPINGASSANLSIGFVRIYSKALSDGEVAQNFNATKDRFLLANVDKTYPTQKYGNRLSESFTATSGYGNYAISYATGSKPGLTWSTGGAITTLNVTETLSATTHDDTITVTDSLGSSTYLPINVTVSKADTLTISMDTATTVVYNASPISIYPKVYYKGLAGVDSLTASTRFTSSSYTDSATVPTDVDTYTVIAANPVFSVGALSNYVNVVYETSTAKVTQANQNKLSINLYGAVAGSSFLIQTFGGSGEGPVTESVTAGSTATGCAVSNHVLSNTSPSTQQLTCNILVTKAASKNYKVETLTATIYFMLYVNNMPTNQVGSGSTIGLNGINQVWVDPGAAPTITGPGAGTYSNNGTATIVITGSGFSLGPVIVKFERNQVGTISPGATDTSMTVTIPSGARTGVFSVTNKNGTEFSSFVITIG